MADDTGANGQGAGTGGGDAGSNGQSNGDVSSGDVAGPGSGGISDVINSLGDGTAGTQSVSQGTNAELFASVTDKTLLQSPALQDITDINGLVKRVVDLNSQIGADSIRLPGENATPEEINAFYSKLGRPEKAEDYGIDPAKGLSEGVSVDPKMKDWFQGAAHKVGLSKQQAEALVGDWNNFINEGSKEYKQQFEHDAAAMIDSMKRDYGVTLKPNMSAGHNIVRELGGDEMVRLLETPFVGNNPAVLRFVAELGKRFGDGRVITSGTSNGGTMMAPAEARAEINRIMAEKGADGSKGAYWDRSHPAHKDTVEKVNRLNAMILGEV
jgi:hypothetical protein